MVNKRISEISVDEIMQKIREEASRRGRVLSYAGEETRRIAQPFEGDIIIPQEEETWAWRSVKKVQQKLQKFPLYHPLYRVAAKFKGFIPKRYEFVNLDDLLRYRDEDFIRNAYRAILKREPDANGMNDWLSRLRSGELNRAEILAGISRSEEAQKRNVKVKGLRLRYLINKSYRIRVAGYFIRVLTGIVNLPKIIRDLNEYQAFTDARLAGKAEREAVEELRPILAGKAEREAVEADREVVVGLLRQVSDHRLNILDHERRMLLVLEELRRRFPEPLSCEQIKTVLKEEDHLLDAMYIGFEDRFRGTRAEIKRKLSVYLPLIDKMKSEGGDVSVVDVGCGRGEWLELLQENGYRAQGIDINKVALQQCREYGLDVIESDVMEYLKELKRGSLDVITGFHLIEHLTFKTLIELFDETLVVLRAGGMILFETPNPANILVSSYDFYRDPGHMKPLHPDTLRFIAESRGFVGAGSYFVLDEGPSLKLIQSTEWALNDINDYIRAPRDFVLIGYKP